MKRILAMALVVLLSWQLPAWGQELYAPEAAVTAPEIQVQDVPEDDAIRSRLVAVLGAIDGLQDIEVQVTSGVVTLVGEVPSARLNRAAFEIASRTDGVVYVLNRLGEEADVASRLRPASRKFQEIGTDLLRALPVGLIALLVVVLFWFLGQWAGSRGAWLRRAGLSDLAVNLGLRVVRLLVIGIGLLIALEILDATAMVGALLGMAGIAGIALGFAFRNIAENYLAGVLLSARNPFAIGDQVQIGEFLGKVVRLTSRDTVLMTPDGNHLRIPNSDIITSAMLNFSRNPLRRFQFKAGIAEGSNLTAARELGIATLRGMTGILPDPGPQVLISELGDSTVELSFLAWIDQRETDLAKARSEAIRLVKAAFDAAGIEMPEPGYRIHLRDAVSFKSGEGAAARHEPATPSRPATAMAKAGDVTVDHAIDEQVTEELRTSDEENLLKKGG